MCYNPSPKKCKADNLVTIPLLSCNWLLDSPRFTDVSQVGLAYRHQGMLKCCRYWVLGTVLLVHELDLVELLTIRS